MLTEALTNSKSQTQAVGYELLILLIGMRSGRLCRARRATRMFAVVAAALGAFLGASIALDGERVFAALVGAFIGFAIAEIRAVRGRLLTLEEELAELRAYLKRHAAQTAQPSPPASESPLAALEEFRRDQRSPTHLT